MSKSKRRDTLRIYGIVNDNGIKDEQCSSSSKDQKWAETCVAGGGVQKARFFLVLERECVPSLYNCRRSDYRISSGREGKLFYVVRTTRGHRFLGVSINSVR